MPIESDSIERLKVSRRRVAGERVPRRADEEPRESERGGARRRGEAERLVAEQRVAQRKAALRNPILRAYAEGRFPMARSATDPQTFLVDPPMRGIIPLDEFRMSRSLTRTVRSGRFEIRIDSAFERVLSECADRPETWINRTIERICLDLHAMGHCHSVECWKDGELAGGLYGVRLGGAFFGESMFTLVRDASKVALAHLVERLRAGGFALLDTQFVTDHLLRFGAVEIPRGDYLDRLDEAIRLDADFFAIERGERNR